MCTRNNRSVWYGTSVREWSLGCNTGKGVHVYIVHVYVYYSSMCVQARPPLTITYPLKKAPDRAEPSGDPLKSVIG